MSLHEFFHEIILHSLVDTCKIIPFLFLTYVIVEVLEHKPLLTVDKIVKRTQTIGPLLGGIVGCVPQCGFSATAANLFGGGLITVGTLISVFLSTSDEMIPILIGSNIAGSTIIKVVFYKLVVSIFVGFLVDIVLTRVSRFSHPVQLNEFCEVNDCHCHDSHSILRSVFKHTVSVSLFVLLTTICINIIIHFIGHDALEAVIKNNFVVSHIIASLIGLIPNCSSSVILSSLYSEGVISVGTLMSGLLTGSGVGTIVLLKVHKHKVENVVIVTSLILVGIIFGFIADIPMISSFIS